MTRSGAKRDEKKSYVSPTKTLSAVRLRAAPLAGTSPQTGRVAERLGEGRIERGLKRQVRAGRVAHRDDPAAVPVALLARDVRHRRGDIARLGAPVDKGTAGVRRKRVADDGRRDAVPGEEAADVVVQVAPAEREVAVARVPVAAVDEHDGGRRAADRVGEGQEEVEAVLVQTVRQVGEVAADVGLGQIGGVVEEADDRPGEQAAPAERDGEQKKDGETSHRRQ